MKSFRGTLVFGILVACLAAFATFDFKRAERAEEKKDQDTAIVRIKSADATKFELTTKSGSMVLEKQGEDWRLTTPVQDSADRTEVASLLSALEDERSKETVAEGEGLNLSTFGLDQPRARLKITAKDGRTEEVKIGSVKAYDGSLYGQLADEKKVLLLGMSWDEHVSKTASDFRDRRLVRSELPEVGFIEINQSKTQPLRLEKTNGAWRVVGSGQDAYPLSDSLIGEFIGEVKSLRATEILDNDKEAMGVKKKHGLDQPTTRVRLARDKSDEGIAVIVGGGKSGEANVPVASSETQPVYAVGRVSAELLAKKAEDFYDKRLPFQFAADEVKRVKIDSPEQKAELVKQGDNWELSDKGLQKTVDSAKLNDLIGALARMDAVRFFEPIASGKPPRKVVTSIILMKESGEPVFEIHMSDLVTEKLQSAGTELTYRPVWTNKIARVVAVPDVVVKNLGLALIVSDAARPSPAPTATAPTEGGGQN